MKRKLTYDIIFEIIFYILLVIYIFISIFKQNMILLYSTSLTIITLALPRFIMRIAKLKVTSFLNFIIVGFIFISMFLAKVNNFYAIPHWDTFLHTISGFITFIIGYILFLYLNNYKVKGINKNVIIAFVVFFAIAMTAVWEMWEFFTDQTFGLMAQVDLFDTMKDIITGSILPIIMIPSLNKYLKGHNNRLYGDLTEFMKNNDKK